MAWCVRAPKQAACDAHLGVFLRCIDAAASARGQGFAAIKVTALGNPTLLDRVSNGLLAIRNLFSAFDLNHDDVVTRDEFSAVSQLLFFSIWRPSLACICGRLPLQALWSGHACMRLPARHRCFVAACMELLSY
jgi:hypothetical protein